ncbi:MAG: tetratricopeptide repeat protein [Candidatus Omnitrophica bacterium]|nr:tetratricopeptide repeat protein [Candidatus Omnitrophota bacterium]
MISIKNITLTVIFLSIFSVQFCLAQQDAKRIDLLKQGIRDIQTAEGSELLLTELLDVYVQGNDFDEFYNFLETVEKKKIFRKTSIVYYYKALTRFRQMQFLEENKMWQELFDNKDSYIADLDESLAKARKLNTCVNPLALRIKFLEAQIKEDNEASLIETLEDLFNLAKEYIETENDVEVIRDIADKLSEEKQDTYAKKLYSVYVTKISRADIGQEELKKIAEDFLKKDKINLAVSLYNAYLDRLTGTPEDRDIIIKEMFDMAEKFEHSGWREGIDPFFAEKLYEKIESLYNVESFDEFSQLQRAYNLERIKEYEFCFEEYLRLIDIFPNYQDKDRIYFRLGILSAYEFNKIDEAKEYFLKVTNNFPQSLDYLNSLYHLGLLNHWQGNLEKADEFYKKILEKTKDIKDRFEIALLAESRIKEIDDDRDIEYNLRMFLGAVLVEIEEEKPYLYLELFARAGKDYLDETIKFQTNSYFTDTGCLQQDFTYLWSGQLGSNQNPFNEYQFETSYQDLGTKVVNVVLVGPSGVVDGTIEMADVYAKSNKE